MRIDEGRRDEVAFGIDDPAGISRDAGLHGGDAAAGRGDVEATAAVRQRRVADDQVEAHQPAWIPDGPSVSQPVDRARRAPASQLPGSRSIERAFSRARVG
jgi:hypothetical protein